MSTSNKKLTGIIYRAYNKESKKSYIGQSVRPLKTRIQEHYRKATKIRHKFANALLAYEKSAWEWSVLKEVSVEELDYYEKFFIDDLDTYNSGYNSSNGNDWLNRKSNNYDRKIVELYHADHGFISGFQFEISKIDPKLDSRISKLVKKEALYCNGWVLAENKDRYDEIMKVYEFYHPEIGIVKCTSTELDRNYIRPNLPESKKNVTQLSMNLIRTNPKKTCYGWMLLKSKEVFDTELKVCHDEYGTYSLSVSEFLKKFNLNLTGITKLMTGKTKTYCGWKLIEEK